MRGTTVKRDRERPRRPKGSGTIDPLPSGWVRARIWIGGERRQKVFEKTSQANTWLETQLAERVTRELGTLSTAGFRPNLRLRELEQEFLDDLERAGRTRQTRRGYRSHVAAIVERWGNLRVVDVDGPQLERITQAMHAAKWSASTIRNRLAALSGMVKLAQRLGYAPARHLPVRRPRIVLASRPEPYGQDEVTALVKAARATKDPKKLCAVLLAADAGLRRSEIVRFAGEDYDAKSVAITVPVRDQEDRPKSGRARVVPITSELAKAIEACDPKPGERVVGKAVWNTADQLPVWLEDVWILAGVEGGVRLHRLRHYWASTLANVGKASPWELMTWGGWASLDMVRRYYHAPEKLNRAPIAALNRESSGHDKVTRPVKASADSRNTMKKRAL
jgi:integrase